VSKLLSVFAAVSLSLVDPCMTCGPAALLRLRTFGRTTKFTAINFSARSRQYVPIPNQLTRLNTNLHYGEVQKAGLAAAPSRAEYPATIGFQRRLGQISSSGTSGASVLTSVVALSSTETPLASSSEHQHRLKRLLGIQM